MEKLIKESKQLCEKIRLGRKKTVGKAPDDKDKATKYLDGDLLRGDYNFTKSGNTYSLSEKGWSPKEAEELYSYLWGSPVLDVVGGKTKFTVKGRFGADVSGSGSFRNGNVKVSITVK